MADARARASYCRVHVARERVNASTHFNSPPPPLAVVAHARARENDCRSHAWPPTMYAKQERSRHACKAVGRQETLFLADEGFRMIRTRILREC